MIRIITTLIFFILSLSTFAQDVYLEDDTVELELPKAVLNIGYFEETPFVFEKNNEIKGMSIMLWERISDDLDLEYNFVAYSTYDSLRNAVIDNEVDVAINPMTVSAKDFTVLDFTQPIVISNLAIAISGNKKGPILQLIGKMWSWEFLVGVFLMTCVILFFGIIAWLFERKHNRDQFSNNPKGLWDSFWWSAVTMTTVGYGDKAPRTIGGRLTAVVWMFTAVIIVASYTATISSSLTIKELSLDINSLNDLRTSTIMVDRNSGAEAYLERMKISCIETDSSEHALAAVINGEIDAYVADEVYLKYMFEEENYEDQLALAPAKFYKQYYAFALPLNSEYLNPINLALIKTIQSEEWKRQLTRFQID